MHECTFANIQSVQCPIHKLVCLTALCIPQTRANTGAVPRVEPGVGRVVYGQGRGCVAHASMRGEVLQQKRLAPPEVYGSRLDQDKEKRQELAAGGMRDGP